MSENGVLKVAAYYKAAALADWGQVVCNGGPPCFHIENDKFCLRAERWAGHGKADHAFVPLGTLLGRVAADSAIEAIDDIDNAENDSRSHRRI